MKRYEHLFLHWVGYIFAVLAAVSVGVVKADTLPPPQTVQQAIAQTPNNQNFSINVNNGTGSYKNPNYTINFNHDQGKNKQFGKISTPLSDPLQGGKQLNVAVKDPYGNTARGTINTQTQLPSNSTLNKLATTYLVGSLVGNVANSPYTKQTANHLANGNYGQAAASAAASFDFFGVGSGIYNFMDEFQNAKAAIGNQLKMAAQNKANTTAQSLTNNGKSDYINAAKANGGYLYQVVVSVDGLPEFPVDYFVNELVDTASMSVLDDGQKRLSGNPQLYGILSSTSATQVAATSFKKVTLDDIEKMHFNQSLKLEDFLLNQAEIQAVIADALTKMLNNQQENTAAIKDLVNMLWQNGQLNPNNTETTVTGSTADNTFLTAPYTPQGSNQAQQTQFIINPDGTMTTSTIPRPDLAPNTAQAPTRQIVNHTSSQTQSNAQNQQEQSNPQAEQQDICKQNPNSLMCAEMKEVDYEDVKLPNEQVNVEFKPADLFAENGICPQPKQIAFYGNTYFLSYDPMCDFATGARPMIILLGIVIAMSMVYATVKEM